MSGVGVRRVRGGVGWVLCAGAGDGRIPFFGLWRFGQCKVIDVARAVETSVFGTLGVNIYNQRCL